MYILLLNIEIFSKYLFGLAYGGRSTYLGRVTCIARSATWVVWARLIRWARDQIFRIELSSKVWAESRAHTTCCIPAGTHTQFSYYRFEALLPEALQDKR